MVWFLGSLQGWLVSLGSGDLPSASQQPEVIEANLLEEDQVGQAAGPFESLPFKNFQIHPLGLVPKKDSQ